MAIGKNGSDGIIVDWDPKVVVPAIPSPGPGLPRYYPSPVFAGGLSHIGYKSLPSTALTGIELRYSDLCLDRSILHAVGSSKTRFAGPVNETLATLSVDLDARSADLGEELVRKSGQYNFVRAEAKDLYTEHLQAIEAFLEDRAEAVRKLDTKGEKIDAVGNITPDGSKDFYAKLVEEKGWHGIVSPFDVPEPTYFGVQVCGSCGAKEGKGGAALLQCSRCKRQKYCSKQCQKENWKKHKVWCNMDKLPWPKDL